jgi:hypothetical protein
MLQLFSEKQIAINAQEKLCAKVAEIGISIERRRDFATYTAIRRAHGDRHLNQAYDPLHVSFGEGDFWLLAENDQGQAIATYCLRRFIVRDFFDLIRSLELWFSPPPRQMDLRFAIDCAIPPFGGEVIHGGGLWIREDYRGSSRLAVVMPHLARALALCDRPFDHDTAMIRNDPGDAAQTAERKAVYMGRRVYGFARVHRFVDGWFPPEARNAVMHLCHATRVEAIASLFAMRAKSAGLEFDDFRNRPFVYQDYQSIHPAAILSQRQQQASI